MTYQQFYASYLKIKEDVDSYRLGQHFINMFIKDESDPLLEGLWEKTGYEAAEQIFKVIEAYQWSMTDLPVKECYHGM